MSLSVGTRLGVYEIATPLGAGGMGEVYRARDTKLGRDVALKVVAASFTHDVDRVARFHREAQLLAALNHPHIATIHGLEESNGASFLVMELVKGETLAERLKTGPVPVREALAIARQVADALQAAHEKGIIHRDLKPANIAFTAEGEVKVLDFGLAKAMDPVGADHQVVPTAGMNNLTHSPTLSVAATQQGVILGTAMYMAPEQARGKPADKRVDIWAFGCVLYEMLTGKRAFEGEDASETMAFVMAREPDWSALPQDLPPAIMTLLERSLEKDPRKRVGDISTVLFVLDDVGRVPRSGANETRRGPAGSGEDTRADPADVRTQIGTAVREATRAMRRRLALVTVGAAMVVGAVAAVTTWYLVRPAPPRIERFTVAGSGPMAPTIGQGDPSVAVTPDGTRLVYVGGGSNGTQLLVRAFDQLEATPIATGVLIRSPFIASDGQSVGFVDERRVLKRVAITGGPAVTVTQLDDFSRGATWMPDNAIIFGTVSAATGLQRISANGGEVTVLTRPDRARGELDHVWPEMLPGGRALLFTILAATGGLDASQVAVLDLNTGTPKTLLQGGSHAKYVPTGHLIYTAGATLRAVAFDLARLETRGTPIPVLPRLATTVAGAGNYALAADGTLVYADAFGEGSQVRTLVWVDREGREQTLGAPPRAYDDISLSPDGRQIVAQITGQQDGGVWIYETQRGTLTRRTFDAAVTMPGWSADGRRIVFASGNNAVDGRGLYSTPADGSASQELLIATDAPPGASSASPDGSALVFENRTGANADIWVLPLQGERKPKPLFETPFSEFAPRFSPDGRWLTYQSNESGRNEVYAQPFPGPGGKWQISTEGGIEPIWSRNGRELFYRNGDKMMAVGIETTPTFRAGTPGMLFEQPGYFNNSRHYDVAPDGQRFLMLKLQGDAASTPPQIVVVKNWFEELKRLVPTN